MEIVNNKRGFTFEALLPDGEKATLEYRWLKSKMVLMHTIVPAAYRGKGIGAELVKYVLEYAKAHHLQIVVYCPYVDKYIKTHPEWTFLTTDWTSHV